jgi:hypothetical protein
MYRPEWWPGVNNMEGLLSIAEKVNMSTTGAGCPLQDDLYIRSLKHALDNWRSGLRMNEEYDNAVKKLVEVALSLYESERENGRLSPDREASGDLNDE